MALLALFLVALFLVALFLVALFFSCSDIHSTAIRNDGLVAQCRLLKNRIQLQVFLQLSTGSTVNTREHAAVFSRCLDVIQYRI